MNNPSDLLFDKARYEAMSYKKQETVKQMINYCPRCGIKFIEEPTPNHMICREVCYDNLTGLPMCSDCYGKVMVSNSRIKYRRLVVGNYTPYDVCLGGRAG